MKFHCQVPTQSRRRAAAGAILLLSVIASVTLSLASTRYTEAQLDALAKRVGTTYWIASVNNRTPEFLAAPAASAPTISTGNNESFEILGLVQEKEHAYYKVKFESGKNAYIRPEVFVEELNLTILTTDPLAGEKQRAAAAAEEERTRVQWIRSQPWPAAAKEAALKRIPTPGLTMAEVKVVMGSPSRVIKGSGLAHAEERWHYVDGSVLTFRNRILTRVDLTGRKER